MAQTTKLYLQLSASTRNHVRITVGCPKLEHHLMYALQHMGTEDAIVKNVLTVVKHAHML